MVVFQSTLPARGATYRVADERYSEEISIHAPRTGSDCAGRNGRTEQQDFNPRSPHGERPGPHSTNKNAISFQSTLPARGATVVVKVPICRAAISIHAPRTGSDEHDLSVPCLRRQFQSTLPARGATGRRAQDGRRHAISIHAPRTGSDARRTPSSRQRQISIHAPRTGSDTAMPFSDSSHTNFNPRSPHGERLLSCDWAYFAALFQSTLPARGATAEAIKAFSLSDVISIHAPRTGSDRTCSTPRSGSVIISIHAPRTGSDLC